MITFDIETLPTNDEKLIDQLCADLRPPANYKNDDAINKWMAEAKLKAVNDTGLNGAFGSVCCICATDGFTEFVSSTRNGLLEADMLRNFFDFCAEESVFCGHNIAGFDLQFIKHRAIINNVMPPKKMIAAMNSKPWDECIKDTMLMWSKTKMISLDTLAWILGIQNNNTIDGSNVAELWGRDPHIVIEKCRNDVSMTMAAYHRLTFNSLSFK